MIRKIAAQIRSALVWWSGRDVSVFVFAFAMSVALTVIFQVFGRPMADDAVATCILVPLLMLYAIVRVIAVVSSRLPEPKRCPPPESLAIRVCNWTAAIALLASISALLSVVPFALVGPDSASFWATVVGLACVFLVIGSAAAATLLTVLKAHRLNSVRVVVSVLEAEIIDMVQSVRPTKRAAFIKPTF